MKAEVMDMDRQRRSTRLDRGFTLVEVLVSLLIAAAAMMAISTMLVMSNRNSSKSRQMTSALSLAQGLADSLRSVRTQDLNAVPWELDQLTTAATPLATVPPENTQLFVPDQTNPNAGYARYYRLECPPGAGVTRLGSVQVTIKVLQVSSGGMHGAGFTGKAYGSGQRGRGTDLVFYMQDPTLNIVTGTGGFGCP